MYYLVNSTIKHFCLRYYYYCESSSFLCLALLKKIDFCVKIKIAKYMAEWVYILNNKSDKIALK